ncbi:MAG TPA: SRPBCC family protein [Hyphomonadaceae bacterium]|nr:SRPBCC family protein [Hyphomonadaceae bacterium]
MSSNPPTAIAVQTFNVGPGKVYDAILDPKMIARFMFGPLLREEEIIHIRNEPKVGGEFSFLVRRGAEEIDHVGRYLELARPRRIVFTWAVDKDDGGSVVFIDIKPTEEGCTLTLTHEMPPQWANFVDRSRGAWEKMLGVLATLL